MDLNQRKLKILHVIISDFIHSAEPVGSRTLSRKYGLGISPATIRNEMADLEEMGYLTHPYTSAGRMPSTKAYRLYVDDLMERYELPMDEKQAIRQKLQGNMAEFDKTIEHAARLLSEMTNLTSFAMTPKKEEDRLKYINILPVDEQRVVMMIVAESGKVSNTVLKLALPYTEYHIQLLSKVMTYNYKGKRLSDIHTMQIIQNFETEIEVLSRLADSILPDFLATLDNMLNVELYLDGMTNIFSIPEYNDIEKAKLFMETVNHKNQLKELLNNRESGFIITIGDENAEETLQECSLITATYRTNGKLVGKIGVIGPTRMKYDKITSVIEYMTEKLSNGTEVTGGQEDER